MDEYSQDKSAIGDQSKCDETAKGKNQSDFDANRSSKPGS